MLGKTTAAIILVTVIFYLITHLPGLTTLPVFADEAIYIRWSQLIMDDWRQYAFFPLNDGKTPLQMWAVVPFQFIFDDQLFAGRFVSLAAGLVQVLVIGWMTRLLGGKEKTAWLAMLLAMVLPFWYFHQRMALIESLLTLCISLAIAATIQSQRYLNRHGLAKNVLKVPLHPAVVWAVISGLSFGLALWTKLPAILFVAAFPLYIFLFPKNKKSASYMMQLSLVSGSIVLGLAVFGLLKLNPAFGQLFRRGNDFLFPWSEVILQGKWTQTIQNVPTYISYFGSYLTWPVLVLVLAGLFAKKHQRTQFVLILSALAFIGPIALLGRVVYPRYLFPAVLFFTLSAALSFEYYVEKFVSQAKQLTHKTVASLVLVFLLAHSLGISGMFIYASIFEPNSIPFVSADKVQYLTEWSSGHGIPEVIEYITDQSQHQSLAIATEGSFGTLPDGLVMYLHRRNVDNLYVEGIGYPVKTVQGKYLERALDYDRQLLVVNSHRMELPTQDLQLVMEVCRPYDAPCLQVWDLTGSSLITNPVPETTNSL